MLVLEGVRLVCVDQERRRGGEDLGCLSWDGGEGEKDRRHESKRGKGEETDNETRAERNDNEDDDDARPGAVVQSHRSCRRSTRIYACSGRPYSPRPCP